MLGRVWLTSNESIPRDWWFISFEQILWVRPKANGFESQSRDLVLLERRLVTCLATQAVVEKLALLTIVCVCGELYRAKMRQRGCMSLQKDAFKA